jgi:predicted nucleotidyltransferase component of viral defense system
MSNPTPTNIAASVEAKLKNICKKQNIDFRFILIRYANERFLYKLSISPFADQFILKGGNLFIVWQNGMNFRPTVDADLLCIGKTDEEYLKSTFLKVCTSSSNVNDGIRFDEKSLEVGPIRDDNDYGGTRIILTAYLGRAKIPLQFDIGIGDAITPAPEIVKYPVLLNGEAPQIKIYPMVTSIAEKTETMVSRGTLNSRMKDFYDIWLLSELFDHDFQTLKQAVFNTFERRDVSLPTTIPESFTEGFYQSKMKQTQWDAFCRKNKLQKSPENFESAVLRIRDFLLPVFFIPETRPVKWIAGKGWQ